MNVAQKDYQEAVDSQTATSVSALVSRLAEILERIWEDARELNGGTDFVNEHPIVRLYVEQLAVLCGGGRPKNPGTWVDAWEACKRGAGVK